MSAKLPHSMMDESTDLQKQIGCMSGIFLLFNRRYFLSSGRITSHNHKRLRPELESQASMPNHVNISKGQSGKSGMEPNSITPKAREKHLEKGVKEKRRVSSESSTTSFSSSSFSSTFSSVDRSKTAQPEQSSFDYSTFARSLSQIQSTKHLDSSPHLRQQSPDLPDVVKDSVGKETYELSVKTTTKPKGASRVVKNVDSPRPPKDAPRFSYDERVSRDKWKSATKPKELPRLSLDSRERSFRKYVNGTEQTNILDDSKHENDSISSETTDQETRSNKKLSSVVAKLMGLEAFPESKNQVREVKSCSDEDLDARSTLSRKPDECTYNKAFRAPKSRFPLESAPWKQPERNRGYKFKSSNPSASVYGEMEKRVTELDFKRSSKDLRALKQILEAMGKSKERVENTKEDDESDLKPQTSNYGSNYLNIRKSTPIPKKGHLKKFESSVQTIRTMEVVQKPRSLGSSATPMENISGHHKFRVTGSAVQHIRKDPLANQKAKDLTPRKNHLQESIQISKAPQSRSGGNPASSATSSTTMSPRLQQKRQSQPNTPTPDSSRARRRLSNGQRVSSRLSHQGDAMSEQSDSNLSLSSQGDMEEVTSSYRSKESSSPYQHKNQKNEIAARSIKYRSNGEPATATLEQPSPVSVLDATFYGEGSPSPVKKISNAFKEGETQNSDEAGWSLVDLDHLPNSTRPILNPQFDQEKFESIRYLVNKLRQVNSQHDEASTDHIASLCETKNPQHRYIAEILLASGMLLKDLGSSRAIIQLQQSSQLVNPSLFLVLEQTKGRIDQSKSSEKIQNKLIFDTVNEILSRKFSSAGFDDPRISLNQLVVKNLSGRKLLKELCKEMDRLQAYSEYSMQNSECSSFDEDDGLISILCQDMMHQAQNWVDCHKEVPGVVLDIERRIFKDLIDEVVRGEDARLQRWPSKQ